ncbi:MAG TPA: hypothetical protein VKY85_18850 [Candidatus Angelobacter sp.]|nr:hypothetical protein [Candidatus Angelobacter sp.]
MLNTIVSLITTLGFGGLIGAFFQSRFEHRKHLNEQEHGLKHKRYLCILILMLTKLDPDAGMRHLKEHRPDLKDLNDLDAEIRMELLNAVLFASDGVISAMAQFIGQPSYSSYVKTAAAMRRDLWHKKTAIDETALKVVAVTEKRPESVTRAAAH